MKLSKSWMAIGFGIVMVAMTGDYAVRGQAAESHYQLVKDWAAFPPAW